MRARWWSPPFALTSLREPAEDLDLVGCAIILDALQVQQLTATVLLDDCAAHYLVTSVKGNQPTMLDDLQLMLFAGEPDHEILYKEHGCVKRRRYSVPDLSDPDWHGYSDSSGRRQTIGSERERRVLKAGETSAAVGHAQTALTPEQTSPAQLAVLVRDDWHIENRLHQVRDFNRD